MNRLRYLVFLSAALFLLFSEAKAIPAKLVSGELFIGGQSYGTSGYQNYMRFYIVGQTRAPQRNYIMQAEQINAIEVNHPSQPEGTYNYQVRMPNHGSSFGINDELFYPVWYDCFWNIESSAQTPQVTADSPQFIIVNSPFQMNGISTFLGAFSISFRIKGQGISELKFEKTNNKYYIREARYTFIDNAVSNARQKQIPLP